VKTVSGGANEILLTNNNDAEYPPEDTVGDQWRRGCREAMIDASHHPVAYGAEWYARVSGIAYELYLRRGRAPGRALDDWLAAERIALSQLNGREGGDERDGEST
jgi:hypothetical protein